MKASLESVSKLIETRKQERRKVKAEYKRERETAQAKIEELTEAHENAETPEAYKSTAEQIQTQKDYLAFLDKRQGAVNTPLISIDEYREIEQSINADHDKLLEACAPKIVKKFDELLALMDEYTEQADELQEVINTAQTACFGTKRGGHLWHELKTKSPDVFGYFNDFCQKYFDRKTLINEVKNSKRKVNTFGNPEKARLFAVLNRNKPEAKA